MLRKLLFKVRKPSEPSSNVNSIQPKPSTDQTSQMSSTAGKGMSFMNLLAKAKEAKEAEKQSERDKDQLSSSSPTKRPSGQMSEEQPLNIMPHPQPTNIQPTKSKWAALAAGAGAPMSQVPSSRAQTSGQSGGQSGGILHSVFSQGADKKTELVCKKSEYIQIVRDIRPAQTTRWTRGMGNQPVMTVSSPRPDTIEEFDEYGRRQQVAPLVQFPEADLLHYHDDHGISVTRAPPIVAAIPPRIQHQSSTTQPSQAGSLVLTTVSDPQITLAQQATTTVTSKQFYSTASPATNLLNTEQFLTSMIELKMELRSEMQKLNSKIMSIDEHILEFAKISTWLVNNIPVAPTKMTSLHHHHHHTPTSALQITSSHLTGATVGDLQMPLIATSVTSSKHKKSSKHHHHHIVPRESQLTIPESVGADQEKDEPHHRKSSSKKESKKAHKEKKEKPASSKTMQQQPSEQQMTAHEPETIEETKQVVVKAPEGVVDEQDLTSKL